MKKIALVRCCCIVLMLLHAHALNAQTLSWDRDSATGIQVTGDGTWNTTTANWQSSGSNTTWNNTTNASTTAVFGFPSPTATAGGTITVSGTINLGGMQFLPFASTPTFAYTFTGGTLAFANNAVIEMGDVTSTGSTTNQFINIASTMTGNNLTIQRSATASSGTFQYFRFAGTNPGLTGTLTIKSNSASLGNFVLVASAAANSGLSRVIVESGSVYAANGTASNYAVPMTLAGTGQGSGAIRLDASNMIFSGAITLSATALLHSNTSITGTVFSGAIGEENGAQGLQRSAVTATSTISFTGASTFTGAVTLGRTSSTGGVNILDFSATGAPTSNIFYNGVTAGALNFVGSTNTATTLNLVGKAGTTNSQSFGAVSTAAGTLALVNVTSGTGGSMDLSLGVISRVTTGLIAFTAPATGTITTTTPNGFVGSWATLRDSAGITSWAQVSSGVLAGFTGDLTHSTGTAVSALSGYAASKHLTISSGSTGVVTVTGTTTDLSTISMTDGVLDRNMALGSNALRLGTTGGIQIVTGARDLTLSGGSLTVGGPTNNTAGQLILTNNSTTSVLTINSNIVANGSGAVTLLINGVSGSKTVLGGTNVLGGGGNIASGALELRSNGALGSTGTFTVFEGAALQLGGGITLSRTLSVAGGGVATDGAIRNIAGDNTIGGVVTTVLPTRIHSDSGTLTFFNTNATTNSFTPSSTSNTLTFSGAGNIVVNSRINHTSTGVVKEGTGRLTLNGDNSTFTSGTFTVSGGVLRVTNANALGANTGNTNTGATTVSAGGTLELAFATDTSLLEPITFDGAGFNGTGAVRNVSGNNTLTGILSIGTTALTTMVADAGTTLTIAGTMRSGATAAGSRTVSLGGAGTINVTGAITNGTTASTYMTGIAKIDSGTVNLRVASTFAPAQTSSATAATILTTVRGGILNLDFAGAAAASHLIFSSNNLSMAGGTLKLTGKDATTNSQSFISTTLAGGRSKLDLSSGTGGTMNMALGTLIRANSSGSVLDITLPTTGTLTTTTLNLGGFGILNSGMTVGKNTWATSAATQTAANISWNNAADTIAVGNLANGTQVSFAGTAPGGLTAGVTYYVVNSTASSFQVAVNEGGTAVALTSDGTTAQMNQAGAITGLTSYSSTFAANANVDVAGGTMTQAAVTVNSLRFNAAGGTTLSLSGTLTSLTGGILVTPNVTGDVTIQSDSATARTITNSTPSDFVVHQHGSGVLTLASTTTLTAVGITKTGTGTLTLAGTATSSAAQVRATEGTLNIAGSNRFTGATDPTFFIGSVDAAAKVSFGNGSSTGAESFTAINVLGTTSSLVGSGTGVYTISMQNTGVNDWRNLMIGGAGTNENNLGVEAFSAGTIQFGAANTYAGRNNIGRSTWEVTVLANAGTASSLGTGSLVSTIDMHDTNSANATVSTLRYLGTTDSVTDRAIRLVTDGQTMPSLTGVVENNGTGTLKFTSAFTAAGNTTLTRTLRLSGTNTGVNEIVSMGDGPTSTVSLDKAGTGRWALTGDSTYTGGTSVSNGTLQLGNGGTAGMVGSGDIAISSTATLATNRSDTFTIGNNITGTGAVVVSNTSTGVTTLSSMNNTYSGGTTVKTGTLAFTNAGGGSATGSGSVTIESTGTLAGTGFVTPDSGKYIDVAGTIRVGLSSSTAATMTIMTMGTGGLGIESTGVVVFDLVSGAGSGVLNGAGSSDFLVLGGNVNLVAGSTLRVENLNGLSNWAAGDAWHLIDWTTLGTVRTDTFTTLDLPTLGGVFQWDTSALYTTGVIAIVVPEPSRMMMLGMALGVMVLRRRR